jgi:hypothetical protein
MEISVAYRQETQLPVSIQFASRFVVPIAYRQLLFETYVIN